MKVRIEPLTYSKAVVDFDTGEASLIDRIALHRRLTATTVLYMIIQRGLLEMAGELPEEG